MNPIQVQFIKTHEDAKLPTRNNHGTLQGATESQLLQNEKQGVFTFHYLRNDGDSGYDLSAVSDTLIPSGGSAVVPVGLQLAFISEGYWFRIEARSGLGFKHSVQPHFGIIDNQYRGDLGVKLYNMSNKDYFVKAGDRIAQIIFYPLISAEMSFTDEVSETSRGEKGFGSSGQ